MRKALAILIFAFLIPATVVPSVASGAATTSPKPKTAATADAAATPAAPSVASPVATTTAPNIPGMTATSLGSFEATCYAGANEGPIGGGNTTATGTPVAPGTIAVDPSVIPLHTTIAISGFPRADYPTTQFQALDTGGAIKGHHIDIYDASPSWCNAWGKQTVTLWKLTPAPQPVAEATPAQTKTKQSVKANGADTTQSGKQHEVDSPIDATHHAIIVEAPSAETAGRDLDEG